MKKLISKSASHFLTIREIQRLTRLEGLSLCRFMEHTGFPPPVWRDEEDQFVWHRVEVDYWLFEHLEHKIVVKNNR